MADRSDMLYDEEVDLQKEATDDALSGVPGDWVEEKYTEAQQLAAPRGAVFETRLAASKVLRSLGNSRFSAGEHAEALFAYERAFWQVDFDLAFLKIEMTEAHQKATYEAQTPVRLNMAQCLLKTGGDLGTAKAHTDACIEACDEFGLEWKTKALYWRAKARLQMGLYDEAEEDLKAAVKAEPADKSLRLALEDCRAQRRQLRSDQRRQFDGKLGPVPPQTDEKRRCSIS